jgi:hypothetical protein
MKLLRYIQGERRGREANRLEREAMKDPFLADALEGFEKTGERDIRRIRNIRRDIRRQTRIHHSFVRNFSIAAGVLLCVGFGAWLFSRTDTAIKPEVMAYSELTAIPEEEYIQQQRQEERFAEEAAGGILPVPGFVVADSIQINPGSGQPAPVDGVRFYQLYIAGGFHIPVDSCSGVKGTLTVEFMVNNKGIPEDVTISKPLCPVFDREVVHLIQRGNTWTPSSTKAVITITI